MMRRKHLVVRACLLAGVALLVIACDDPFGSDSASTLSLNQEKWERLGPASYDFEFRRVCFCPVGMTARVRITVTDEVVTEVVLLPGGEPVDSLDVARFFMVTVDSLFGVVERAIAVGADRLSVDYDAVLGYPTDITIDYDTQTVDEELALDALLVTAPLQHRIRRNAAATRRGD